MRQKKQHPNMNVQWFKDRMAERKLSIRSVAKMMDKDPTSTSFLLKGVRAAQPEDVVFFANLFSVPTAEIRKQYGMPDGDIYADKLKRIWLLAVNASANNDLAELKKTMAKISEISWN